VVTLAALVKVSGGKGEDITYLGKFNNDILHFCNPPEIDIFYQAGYNAGCDCSGVSCCICPGRSWCFG
jgi:hypothetical protein